MASRATMYGCGLLTLVLMCALGSCDDKKLRTTNVDAAFARWGNPVYYYLDPAFTPAEVNMINQAINSITASLSSCVTFSPVPASSPLFKIKFTPLTGGPGSPPQTYCFAVPGVNITARQTGTEQIVSLARGPTGCLDSYCSIMKYLAICLGKRNEHQRGDRDSWITVQPDANLAVPGAYTKYTTTQAYWSRFPYDYCSITHNQPTDFAKTGIPAFTIPAGKLPGFIPKLCTLSTTDCQLISMMRGCNPSLCASISCASQTPTTSTALTTALTTPATTTTGPTTTLAPCLTDICSTYPDEATRLVDGRIMVFAGMCAQELDPVTNKKKGAAIQISDLFSGGVTGPLQAVWQTSATQLRILTQAGTQYVCTGTSCSTETATKTASAVTSVFETVSNPGASPTWPATTYTVDSSGITYSDDSAPGTPLYVSGALGNSIPELGSWTAVYRTNTLDTSGFSNPPAEIINVIGKDLGGVVVLQPMVYSTIPFPGFGFPSAAVPAQTTAMWC